MEISMASDQHPRLLNGPDNRSKNELIVFTSISTVLLIVRLLTLIFFTVQTLRYVRVSQR